MSIILLSDAASAEELKVDSTVRWVVCNSLISGDYEYAIQTLVDVGTPLEKVHNQIKCRARNGTPIKHVTSAHLCTTFETIIAYLKGASEHYGEDMLTPVLMFVDPNEPKDRSVMDIALERMQDAPEGYRLECANEIYNALIELNALHSPKYCKEHPEISKERCMEDN